MPLLKSEQINREPADRSRSSEQRIGGIILGGCFQGLGIVRSLGRSAIPVCVLDDQASIARYSRYSTQAIRVKHFQTEEQIIETLLQISRRFDLQSWVLFPTREEQVMAIARHRDQLSKHFRVPTPNWEITRWAWDKRLTYQLADRLDIPAPHTWYPQTMQELPALYKHLPLLIKPAIKEHFIYATGTKAWRVNTPEELSRGFETACKLLGPNEVMLQEVVPGDGSQQFSYCAFFKEGRAIGRMVAQRRRQHPPELGRASTYVESVELAELDEPSLRFLQAINYYGLVEMEYKYDARVSTFKLLDVNARTWGYHSLGARAGVDFPNLLFADQLGQPVEPCQAQAGITWMRLLTDLPTAGVELYHGRLDRRWYLHTLKHFNVEAVFDRHDPLPGLAEIALLPYLIWKRGF